MCDLEKPRFLTFYHCMVLHDDDMPIDQWMENNIPVDYHVCGVIMREIVDTSEAIITFSYEIICERKYG